MGTFPGKMSIYSRLPVGVLALWQSAFRGGVTLVSRFLVPVHLFPSYRCRRPRVVTQFLCHIHRVSVHFSSWWIASPLCALCAAFGERQAHRSPPAVIPVFSSTLLPGFFGRNFITTTGSSATRHVMPRPLESLLAGRVSVKKKILSDDTGLPQLMSGFPVEYAVLNHCVRYDQVLGFALFCTLTSPPQPYLVRFRYVHSTSYGFLQTLSLPITPLPFGLSSPWSG